MDLKAADLRLLCQKYGCPYSSTKTQLAERIIANQKVYVQG